MKHEAFYGGMMGQNSVREAEKQRGPGASETASSLITGFLGSGKTTLLNRLLTHPGMAETAVIVNEFGEVGLDHLLIETTLEDAVLLQSGCICCTIRGDLIDTLATLRDRRSRGEIPPFRRLLIETTGLADPAPILQTLMSEPKVVRHYRLDRVITTVDVVNAGTQLDEHYESAKQTAIADRLVLTKTDLASIETISEVTARLRALNPAAPILTAVHGAIEPEALFEAETPARDLAALEAWIGEQPIAGRPAHDHGHTLDDKAMHQAHHGIETFCITRHEPISWDALKAWLEALASLRGADFLRLKGIVNVAGFAGPVVIHGVQHVFHPPRELSRWPSEDRRTRIVFIARNIPRHTLEASFSAVVG